MNNNNSYGKQEKLKSRKLLGTVFGKGKSFLNFPVKVTCLISETPTDFPVKAGVGVSTRFFKKAVDRNRVKRLLRETYRLNKSPLIQYCTEKNLHIAIFFLYVDKQLPEFETLQTIMQAALKRLMSQLERRQGGKEAIGKE
ncbi:MAG: ribonuclease P protein component [Bacteroidota bacterium]